MNLFSAPRENRWRTAVFLLWITALSFLLLKQRYTVFLRPEFGILLVLGVLVLLGFLFSDYVVSKPRPFGYLGIVRYCIIILPLAYMINSGEKLDSFAFKNRFLGPSSMATETAADLPGKIDGLSAPNKSEPFPAGPPYTGAPVNATLLDLTVSPQQYIGKLVSVVGMVAESEGFTEIVGGEGLLLFRFVVNCCTADGTPAYALVRGTGLPDFPEDIWVKVQGVFDLTEVDRYRIPIIDNAVIEETSAPKIPYLF